MRIQTHTKISVYTTRMAINKFKKSHEETLDFPEVVAEDGVNVGLIRPVEEQPRRGIQPLVPEHYLQLPAVLGIRDMLVRIRIPGFVSLTNESESGSDSFLQ
jgi:hypothetical protein